MHKRILVAEAADTTRSVAESVLRQHGFEVISVASADKAMEVLQFSKPDVIVAGAELVGVDGRPFYEQLQNDPRTKSVPLLLFDSADSAGLPFPDEVVIPRPFDPKDFVQRVQVFAGQPAQPPKAEGQSKPFENSSLDDELLDAALGLDSIQVTASEVMDKTVAGKGVGPKKVEKMVGLDHQVEEDDMTDSGKVESLMIHDEAAEVAPQGGAKKAGPQPGTGKIEIVNDQFGMTDPAAASIEPQHQEHDYDWFVSSMREEVSGADPAPSAPAKQAAENSDESLNISDNASLVDPVTPGPTTQAASTTATTTAVSSEQKAGGVEKFIDEFREEMERIRSTDEPEMVAVKPDGARPASKADHNWEETLEQLNPEKLAIFTNQFANSLAEKIAAQIVSRIDHDKLMQLIAKEIAHRIGKPSK